MGLPPIAGPLAVPKRTVFTAAGRGDLARITSEMVDGFGYCQGIVRLLNGVEGRAGGFGRVHIEARRMDSLNGLGYRDVISYVSFALTDFDRIARQEDGRLILLKEQTGRHHRVICQWDAELSIWSVTTAYPAGDRSLDIIWKET